MQLGNKTGRATAPPMLVIWLAVCLPALLALACSASEALPTAETNPAPDWYTVYFTDPQSPKADSLRGGPDADLAAAIDTASASVDAAVYELNLWSLRDALIRAEQRGVSVRLVIESDNLEADEVQALVEAGIPVRDDQNPGLMHNKFVVIDRQEVWSGSMNWTITDGYRNNNNLLRLRSQRLAQDYTAEFEEMFSAGRFGEGSPANTPYPALTIEGTPVQVCFAPEDGCLAQVLEQVRAARQEIVFLAFSFTSDELAQALVEMSGRGVQVSGVMEADQVVSNQGSEYEALRAAGLDVRRDGNPRNMHDKVIVIDRRIVITGSYNFSRSAEIRNDENLLILENPEIAKAYQDEFEKLFSQASP